jgi:hypothetical protein
VLIRFFAGDIFRQQKSGKVFFGRGRNQARAMAGLAVKPAQRAITGLATDWRRMMNYRSDASPPASTALEIPINRLEISPSHLIKQGKRMADSLSDK